MENTIKILVCGGRDFCDESLLYKTLDEIIENYRRSLFPPDEIIIVQGDARGADSLAKRYAEERDLRHLDFPADWKKYGKRAGFVRNKEMLEVSDAVVAFWDGRSSGTKHTIHLARISEKPLRIVNYGHS